MIRPGKLYCWKCETPIATAPGLGLYCPNLRCGACKSWGGSDDGSDDDDDTPPPSLPDIDAPRLTLAEVS